MRILQIHFGKDGGAERFFVNLVKALGERGVEQKFILRPNRSWRGEIEPWGDILENHHRHLSFSKYWLNWKIHSFVRDYQPDVIFAWMEGASRLMPNYRAAIKITRLGHFPKKLRPFKNSDIVIGNIPGIGEGFRELGWKRRVEMISNFPKEVIVNPVTRASLDTPADAFVIAGSGRLVAIKGFEDLIRATSKLDNAWLWLIGDGEERARLERIARETGMDGRIRFCGWQNEPAHILASSDVFCMPSHHEPFGNVLLEAWSLGIPVVTSRSEGPQWFMHDEEDSLIVDIGDVEGYTNAFSRLQDNNKLRATLIAGGYSTLANNFSKDDIVDQYMALFRGGTGKMPM